MPDSPKDPRATTLAALDDGWGDLLEAASPPVPAMPSPIATVHHPGDAAAASLDDAAATDEGVPLPTPVPLRTRVPIKPVLRGLHEDSQPIDVAEAMRRIDAEAERDPSSEDSAVPVPVIEPEPPPKPELQPVLGTKIAIARPALEQIVDDDDVPLPATPAASKPDSGPSHEAKPGVTKLVDEKPSSDRLEMPPEIAAAIVAAATGGATPRPATPPPRTAPGLQRWWIGGSAAVVLVAVTVLATRSNGEATPEPAARSSSAAMSASVEPAPSAAGAEPAPSAAGAEPAPAAATPIVAAGAPPAMPPAPDEAAAPTPAATPPGTPPTPVAAAAPPPPEVDESDPLAAAQASLEAGRFEDAHRLAKTAFASARDNEAMRLMATAACQLDDGVLAREAYRSLAGPKTRAEVFKLCHSRGVDVRSKADGYTTTELLAKAKRLAELGEASRAYEIAREANKQKRSAVALELMGTTACQMGEPDKAAYVAKMISEEGRARITEQCKAKGLELPTD